MAEKTQVPVATLEYQPTVFELALLKHKSKLILVSVLAVGGVLGYWGWKLVKEAKHEAAAEAFTRAKSVEELKKVADEYAGRDGAGSALVYAADKLAGESKHAEAIATLKDFLAKYPEHPLRDLASWRTAEYTAATGDMAAATSEYETLSQSGSPFSALASLRLGDIKWGAGETDKAKEIYDKILKSPVGTAIRADAQERMDKALKTKPPTLVQFLLPPPSQEDTAPPRGGGRSPQLPPGFNMPGGPTPGNPSPTGLPPGINFDQEPITIPPTTPGGKPFDFSLLDEPPSTPPTPPPAGGNTPGTPP